MDIYTRISYSVYRSDPGTYDPIAGIFVRCYDFMNVPRDRLNYHLTSNLFISDICIDCAQICQKLKLHHALSLSNCLVCQLSVVETKMNN